jgi:hypothetical protein
MSWLVNIVVVEVTKLGLHALASRALYDLLWPLVNGWIFFVLIFFTDYLPVMQRNCCSEELDTLFLTSHDRDKQIKDIEIERNVRAFWVNNS